MSQEQYKQDLQDIKDMMNKSSKFMSLSGFSGISAGVIALIGACLAYQQVYQHVGVMSYSTAPNASGQLIMIAIGTLVLSLSTAFFFTSRKSKREGQKIWDVQTKQLIINLLLPLTFGGLICLIFLLRGYLILVAPLTLVFYGLALINASKYTLGEIRSLGILQCALGVIALYWIGHGLIFWAIGFGFMHILYGIIMLIKYKS